jgi:hypothetical protein
MTHLVFPSSKIFIPFPSADLVPRPLNCANPGRVAFFNSPFPIRLNVCAHRGRPRPASTRTRQTRCNSNQSWELACRWCVPRKLSKSTGELYEQLRFIGDPNPFTDNSEVRTAIDQTRANPGALVASRASTVPKDPLYVGAPRRAHVLGRPAFPHPRRSTTLLRVAGSAGAEWRHRFRCHAG